jgi:hypothetical protein
MSLYHVKKNSTPYYKTLVKRIRLDSCKAIVAYLAYANVQVLVLYYFTL